MARMRPSFTKGTVKVGIASATSSVSAASSRATSAPLLYGTHSFDVGDVSDEGQVLQWIVWQVAAYARIAR